MLAGLTQINVELTSRCDKATLCKFCGHQDQEINPKLQYGDMRWAVGQRLAKELYPLGMQLVVQFHRDGDPGASPNLGLALRVFDAHIRSIVTHGEKLGDLGPALIGHCESICISIFRGDPDKDLQLASIKSFLDQKGDQLPRVFLKVVGDMSDEELTPYTDCVLPIMRRLIHTPTGNAKYAHRLPTMPEHGVCLDLLHHPSVAWDGRVYLCNRLDTADRGLIGDLKEHSLDEIWNGPLRQAYVASHLAGRRGDVPPCRDCTYYGIPAV